MTGKMIELLISLSAMLDEFLNKINDTIVYGNGVGGATIGYFNMLSTIVMLFLFGAFVWNVGEAFIQKSHTLGDTEQLIPWGPLKKCVSILILATLMHGASAVFYKNPETGTYLGIGYQQMVHGLSKETMDSAMETLGAVDIVENWMYCLNQFNDDRRDNILKAIAVKDPATAKTYETRRNYAMSPDDAPMSVAQKLMTIGATAGSAITAGSFLLNKMIINLSLYGFASLIVVICTFFFIFQAGRTILILAFYVKLAALLTVALLPMSIGLLYFEHMRSFATGIIKQVIVLALVAGTLGVAVEAIFCPTMIRDAMAIALKSDLAPYSGKVSNADIMMFEASTNLEATASMLGGTPSPMITALDGIAVMSPQQVLASMMSVVKIMFLLGTMLMIIAKLYELISGLMDGHWDPFQEGAKAAG